MYFNKLVNRIKLERAPTGQQAHSPGQSETAPRESNTDTPRPARAKA